MSYSDLETDKRSEELYERACAFHSALDIPGPRPYRRNVVVGSLQPTPQFATRRQGQLQLLERWVRERSVVDDRGDGTVPRQSVAPPEWNDDSDAMAMSQSHMALPISGDVFHHLYNILTATPRAKQSAERAALAISVPDLVLAGTDVDIRCQVAEGDQDLPLLVRVEDVSGSMSPRQTTPRLSQGDLIASFRELPPGDYRVSVQSAVDAPDVRAVWDGLTVVNTAIETSSRRPTSKR